MSLFVRRAVFPPLFALLLVGCASVGPNHAPPDISLADRWQAPLPHGGSAAQLRDWWAQFADPVLLTLLESAAATHPNLQRALAAIQEARATLSVRQADGLPRVDASATLLRSGNRSTPPPGPSGNMILPETTTQSSAGDAKWELDLFGGVQRATEAATARLMGREGNWHDAQVSLAAEVASKYVNYRACRQLLKQTTREMESRRESLQMTEKAVAAGLTPATEARLAAVRLSESTGALTAQQATCDLAVKSLCSLSGLEEPVVRALLQSGREAMPRPTGFVVASLPADLLTQRPDLAALERELAASSAEVGVAEASRYPRLTLLGNLAISSVQMTHLTLGTQPWSLGSSLVLPLLDGGARVARVEEAQARYEQALARYLGAIRVAVEEVEAALVNLESARRRAEDAHAVTAQHAANHQTAERFWRAGGSSRLALLEVERALLAAERAEIGVQRELVQSWIALYKALGGGWAVDVAEK
ncbi:MAG: efflux transporter outer membrane subunit [Magnetococcus sp. XQGC-1]